MRAVNCLDVILMVRRRSEEAAERALAATGQKILQWRIHAETSRSGLAGITASRIGEIQSVATADHYQSSEARYKALLQQCGEAQRTIDSLEAMRAQQMQAYIAARQAREVAEKLQEQRVAAQQAEVRLREQKWNEDMFLARKVANSDRTMDSEPCSGPKESA